MITWYQIDCPHCQKTNWIDNGDVSDITVEDTDAAQCFSCEKKFWLHPEAVEIYKLRARHTNKEYTDEEYLEKFSNWTEGVEKP